jgi:hypothetical protein
LPGQSPGGAPDRVRPGVVSGEVREHARRRQLEPHLHPDCNALELRTHGAGGGRVPECVGIGPGLQAQAVDHVEERLRLLGRFIRPQRQLRGRLVAGFVRLHTMRVVAPRGGATLGTCSCPAPPTCPGPGLSASNAQPNCHQSTSPGSPTSPLGFCRHWPAPRTKTPVHLKTSSPSVASNANSGTDSATSKSSTEHSGPRHVRPPVNGH